MYIETGRLILRPWVDTDTEELFRHAQNPNVASPCGWPPHKDIDDSRNILNAILKSPENCAIELKTTGKPVGSIGLMTIATSHTAPLAENEGEIGYWLGEDYWGQGLMPEAVTAVLRYAFGELKLSRVWAGYFPGNNKSRRVQEKCGFAYMCTDNKKYIEQLNTEMQLNFTAIDSSKFRVSQL
ncbi:MAG: GNAT family N-acetyltransferase [Oscillospiraceae bacterium]|jgi:RimJ/RimL family protein N-acetyltransferase|nr:GNAT family N-acetyltransferase [Oscillospiraceae bacterium]